MSAGITIVPVILMFGVGLVGLVAALIFWAIRGNKRAMRGVAVLSLLIAIVIVGGVFFFGVRPTVSEVRVGVPAWQSAPINGAVVRDPFLVGDDWLKRIDDQTLTRDIYTSVPQLTTAMAAKVEAACEQVGADTPRRIVSVDVSADIVKSIFDAIDAKSFDANDPQVVNRTEDQTWVNLSWQNRVRHQPEWSHTTLTRGQLVARINGPKGASQVMLSLDEKPWLTEAPAIPGSDYTVVVASGQPSATREQAVRALEIRVRDQLVNAISSRGNTTMASPPTNSQVYAQLADAISQRQFQADRVVVGIDRPVGRVWYAAALINLDSHRIAEVAYAAANLNQQRRAGWATLTLALGGMLLVLALVYAGLNAVTRGYLRGRLIAGMAVAAVILVVTMVLFLG